MSSATPTRPGPPPLATIGIAAAVAIVVVIVAIWALAAGGFFSAFVHWFFESNLGTALRFILEALVMIVCVLL